MDGDKRQTDSNPGRRVEDISLAEMYVLVKSLEMAQTQYTTIFKRITQNNTRANTKFYRLLFKRVKALEAIIEAQAIQTELRFRFARWGIIGAGLVISAIFSSLVFFLGDRVKDLLIISS